jgi:hypothetical protein
MSVESDPGDYPLYIHGHGCISCAGADAASLYKACVEDAVIADAPLERSLGDTIVSYRHRPVAAESLQATLPRHPRLRRSSNVTKFAVSAAHQAIGNERLARIKSRELNIGIVVSLLNGCVNYSNRFYGEALADPALASPILFPETVFNAPASHVAAYLECDGPTYTLIGDAATWFSAIRVAEDWISNGLVEGCLVICAEESDWLTLEGIELYARDLIATEGAAAIYVEANPSAISIQSLHGPFPYTDAAERRAAIADAWEAQKGKTSDLLVDGLISVPRLDRDEAAITNSWQGDRLSPAKVLGEGMGIRGGLQTIAAIEALGDRYHSVTILAPGGNHQAFSARLVRHHE